MNKEKQSLEIKDVKSEFTASEIVGGYGAFELLNYIDIYDVVDYFGEGRILDFLGYGEYSDPIEHLIAFKKMVSPNKYCDKEDLKKLICNYIDDNMTHAIG